MSEPALFADRDGTLIEFVSYLASPDRIELLPTVPEGVRAVNDAGIPVIVTTNQSGIGRGYFDWDTVESVHETITSKLAEEGARIDDIYICPHVPCSDCDCRKPGSGMLLEAAATHDIDLKKSYMIGDRESDIEAGNNVDCKTILFPSVESEVDPAASAADHVVYEFREVLSLVLTGYQH